MIRLDISVVIFLYLLMNVVGVLLLWLFTDFRMKKFSLKNSDTCVYKCPICTFVYVDSFNDNLSQCPRCKSYNEKDKINHREVL